MADHAEIEIIGFSYGSCGPFPCNEERSCDLQACSPTENLVKAVDALKERLTTEYPGQVAVKFTLLDDGVPEYVQKIVEEHQPPLPIVLVNGRVTPVGRISMPLIKKEIDAALN